MKKVIIFTKNECPNCKSLGMFLNIALKRKYDKNIEHLNMEDSEEEWEKYDSKLDITSVPTVALEENGEILEVIRGFKPPQIKEMLESNFD